MDINRLIRNLVEEGDTRIGTDTTIRSLETCKLVIVARNCKDDVKKAIQEKEIPVFSFTGTNQDLGNAAGKPFPVAVIGVIDPKTVNIGDLLKAI